MSTPALAIPCLFAISVSAAVQARGETTGAGAIDGVTPAALGAGDAFGDLGGGAATPGPAAAFHAGAQPWQLGVDLLVTFTSRRVALFGYGFAGAYALTPWLLAGINHVGIGTARILRGDRLAISGGPYLELHTFVGDRFDPFLEVGAPVQVRLGTAVEARFGAAPYAGIGLRYWVNDMTAVGALTRLHYVATDGYLLLSRIVPQEAVVWMFGLTTEVRL